MRINGGGYDGNTNNIDQQKNISKNKVYNKIGKFIKNISSIFKDNKHSCMRSSSVVSLKNIKLEDLPKLPTRLSNEIQTFDKTKLNQVKLSNNTLDELKDAITLVNSFFISPNRESDKTLKDFAQREDKLMADLNNYLDRPSFNEILNNPKRLAEFTALLFLKNGVANCQAKSEITASILKQKGYNVEMVSFYDKSTSEAKLIGQEGLHNVIPDHVFLLINRDSSTDLQDSNSWNNDSYILDAWSSACLPGYHLPTYSDKIPMVSGGVTQLEHCDLSLTESLERYCNVLTDDDSLILNRLLNGLIPEF